MPLSTIILICSVIILSLIVLYLLFDRRKNNVFKGDLYSTLFQKSADPVLLIHDDKFVDFNEAAVKYIGFSKGEEMLNVHPSEISPEYQSDGKTSKEKADEMMAIARKNGYHKFDWEHQSRTGEILNVEVSLTIIVIRNTEYIYTLWRDISFKKKAELDLILAKEKALESERLKSAFLESISHEIRTPMNAIIGFSQLLGHEETSKEDTHEFINYINRSANALLMIIDNILDVSTLRSGVLIANNSTTDLNVLLKDIYDMFEYESNFKDVVFKLENKIEENNYQLITDGSRLKKSLYQLVSNAMKFTEKGYVKLVCNKGEDNIIISVQDTGIGIENKDIDYVFNVFRKGSPRGEKLFGGTGLGLSIAKASVESMGGKIWLESEVGKGTQVYIELPLQNN